MQSILVSVLTFFVSLNCFSAVHLAPDETEVYAVSSQFDAAWNMGDSAAAANLFAENATMITPEGVTYEGREKIKTMFQTMMKKMPKSTHQTTIARISHLAPEIVLVDGSCVFGGMLDSEGQPMLDEEYNFSAILVKANGKWMIQHLRGYIFKTDNPMNL